MRSTVSVCACRLSTLAVSACVRVRVACAPHTMRTAITIVSATATTTTTTTTQRGRRQRNLLRSVEMRGGLNWIAMGNARTRSAHQTCYYCVCYVGIAVFSVETCISPNIMLRCRAAGVSGFCEMTYQLAFVCCTTQFASLMRSTCQTGTELPSRLLDVCRKVRLKSMLQFSNRSVLYQLCVPIKHTSYFISSTETLFVHHVV